MSLAMARYHVALALGMDAQDPSLPDSGGSLRMTDPSQQGYLNKVFPDFLARYDDQTVRGHIFNIRNGQEELLLPRRIGEALEDQEVWRSETPSREPHLSEEMGAELSIWMHHQEIASHSRDRGKQDELFPSELTPVQRDIRRGALYLLAAQVAIGIVNQRVTYDPLLDGSTRYVPDTSDYYIEPATPEARLRSNLRLFRTPSIEKFAEYCITRGSEYIPALRDAGLLPQDYPDNDPKDEQRMIHLYRERLGAAGDSERDKHKKHLRDAVTSPKLRFVSQSRSRTSSQGTQQNLF
jgi:hypothetical protein